MFPGMYSSYAIEQSFRDEYDTDIGLEYDEGDAYKNFVEFYEDVLPEFKALGKVVQFKVCVWVYIIRVQSKINLLLHGFWRIYIQLP